MRDRLHCIGCYPTALGVEEAEAEGADSLKASVVEGLDSLCCADLFAVSVIVDALSQANPGRPDGHQRFLTWKEAWEAGDSEREREAWQAMGLPLAAFS